MCRRVDVAKQKNQNAQCEVRQTGEYSPGCAHDRSLCPRWPPTMTPLPGRDCSAAQGTKRRFARDRSAQHGAAVMYSQRSMAGWKGLAQALLDQRALGRNDMHAPASRQQGTSKELAP